MREEMLPTVTNRMSLEEIDARGRREIGYGLDSIAAAICTVVLCASGIALISFRSRMQPWVLMWLLAVSIFAICKYHSWLTARSVARRADWKRNAAYLFLWPGMNSSQFLDSSIRPPRPTPREWFVALTKTLLGAAMIWVAVRLAPQPLLAAWIGMVGLVLVMHFGIFHFLSLIWRTAGIAAQPIMQYPLRSRSLSEFWGKRWNLGFRELSHDWIFKPLHKQYGVATATFIAFLASGVIHDLVISVPAHAGYGLPTSYFALQGCGVLMERSAFGIRLGLGRGITGWLWMALLTTGPAYWLFHPWFALQVMVPFLRAIGAGC